MLSATGSYTFLNGWWLILCYVTLLSIKTYKKAWGDIQVFFSHLSAFSCRSWLHVRLCGLGSADEAWARAWLWQGRRGRAEACLKSKNWQGSVIEGWGVCEARKKEEDSAFSGLDIGEIKVSFLLRTGHSQCYDNFPVVGVGLGGASSGYV